MEKLIEEVRKKQYLYDPRHRCYKDQALVKNTWTQIAIQLGFKDGKDNLIIHDQRHGTTWIQLNIYWQNYYLWCVADNIYHVVLSIIYWTIYLTLHSNHVILSIIYWTISLILHSKHSKPVAQTLRSSYVISATKKTLHWIANQLYFFKHEWQRDMLLSHNKITLIVDIT